jgi:signal transduction histidine kinase
VFLLTAIHLMVRGGPAWARILLYGAMAAGFAGAIVRGVSGAKSLRGRLCAVGWNLALLLVSVVLACTVQWRMLVIPAAAAIIVFGRPRHVQLALGAGLIVLGLYGFIAIRAAGFGFGIDQDYGLTMVGASDLTFYLPLPQSYAYLLLGGWIWWRTADRNSPLARRVLGRLAEPGIGRRPWGLLLVPVAVMAAALLVPNLWFGPGVAGLIWPVLILGAVALFIRAAPGRAATTAVACMLALGLAGVYLGATYSQAGWHLPVNSAGYIEFGMIEVTSKVMAGLALIEGLAVIGAGLWLVPRAAPGLMRYAGYRELAQRVQRLTETRAVAVDTAAADLRRLERDLHDGAQARLVALGMHLRAVEKLIPTNPDAALALVAEARDTSARALTELRELVRGVHPPVLADRGLADAIRALALDSPLRIHADVDLSGRLPAPIETACYFAVAELLTNAAKHSGARDARITAEHRDGLLRIVVTDFGLGGAAAGAGTGLAGVERRLATFDGILAVSSPAGGPTIVVIEIPCALSPAVLT